MNKGLVGGSSEGDITSRLPLVIDKEVKMSKEKIG